MAPRSTRSPRGRQPADDFDEEGGVAAFLIRNRLAIGGVTAFTVAFSYVAANALWYQPHAHGGAFFETRPASAVSVQPVAEPDMPAEGETVIRLEREQAANPTPDSSAAGNVVQKGDPMVETVQRVLAGLNLYEGDVDGLNGPQTRGAIEAYRKMVGLEISAAIDTPLLTQLGVGGQEAATRGTPGTDMMPTASAATGGDARVMRIQAGLKAFGNEGIEIDGVVGSRTRSAIKEFQSLFGLPETGDPDEGVYVKMREIGLTE